MVFEKVTTVGRAASVYPCLSVQSTGQMYLNVKLIEQLGLNLSIKYGCDFYYDKETNFIGIEFIHRQKAHCSLLSRWAKDKKGALISVRRIIDKLGIKYPYKYLDFEFSKQNGNPFLKFKK